jgi:phosphoglycerate dehydrogenase-like enzyme
MIHILIDAPIDEAAMGRLKAMPGVTVDTPLPHHRDWVVPEEWLAAVEVMLCRHPPGNLGGMTGLKLMQLSSVGYDHLRHLNLADAPFRICNARGVFDTAIGEWNLAMMVNLTRDLGGMMRNQAAAHWDRSERYAQEIRGRVVGLWGYGGIGRETARLAKGFGMTVHVLTRTGVRPRLNTYAQPGTGDPDGALPHRLFVAGQEHAFLSGLDFLVLALPHTRLSDGMVGEAEFQALPRTAFMLNPARGPIVQEAALLRALREGWIAGAALDTHFTYPLTAEHPLWGLPNVILTPHVSGSDRSRDFPGRIGDLFVQNVTRYREGRPLLNEITAGEWREA